MDQARVTPNLECLHQLCLCLERATITAERLPQMDVCQTDRQSINDMAKEILSKGLSVVKEFFKECVRADESQEIVPQPLQKEKAITDREVQDELDEADSEPPARNNEEGEEGIKKNNPNGNKNFLPPSCLLPRLLEVPRAAHLHQFVRVLGLYQDYSGLLDLIEWMALYADELKSQAEEQRNGTRMFRRCLVATRVFLELSWNDFELQDRENHVLLERDVEKASEEILQSVRNVIQENPGWGGGPEDEEVKMYLQNGRFI